MPTRCLHQPIVNLMGQIFCTSGITIDLTNVRTQLTAPRLSVLPADPDLFL